MSDEYPKFEVARTESLPPDERKAGDIFSRLGYKLPDAVADLVDNSVDAKAKKVLIRFVRHASGIHSVIIADNGEGMSSSQLLKAMRFGSDTPKNDHQLGKYGIGLKSASLSQAECVTVLTRVGSSFSGCRWTLKNLKNKWTCEVLADAGVKKALGGNFGHVQIKSSGTVVIWERLEHLRALPQNIDRVMEKAVHELCIELGIRFHRFIETRKLAIAIDQQFVGEGAPETSRLVTPLNPFAYPVSGHTAYPITLKLKIGGVGVNVDCHIWPPKSNSPGYKLGGGKVALRQGFYFYRNDRVIQAGGWNGLLADDGEPHQSLSRVSVDLPAKLDSMFKLDVMKSHLDPSPQFLQALSTAKTSGITFSSYLKQAQLCYRKQKKKDSARFPFVPGSGISSAARNAITRVLEEKGVAKPKKVRFLWAQLDHDEVFRVDGMGCRLILNSKFKKELSEGEKKDAPALKMSLMFLLQDELEKTFQTQVSKRWVQQINLALLASLKG